MTSREFCYWLQGFFEIARGGKHAPSLDLAQVECIEKHLALVFKHEIDPSYPNQEELNKIHNPQPSISIEDIKNLVKEEAGTLKTELERLIFIHEQKPHSRPPFGGGALRC